MTQASASLALDARALALLGRLLDEPADERARQLDMLATTDPALQARVARLLRAAADTDGTRAVAAPVARSLQMMAAARHQAGDRVAGWRLLRELGQGGMSAVWLAERADGSFKREVAIKLPLAAHLGGTLAERFARERDVLAALNHPHIARLYDAGATPEGQPYIVLEFVQGLPITAHAEHARLSRSERLALFRQVLAAVDHAHRHLVVHRDLKPANILVDAQGQVKLLDFGIAKLLAPAPDGMALTQDAGAVLTPRYAAPEQVLGQPVSTATDVYAAGVVLYELLTGGLPYARDQTELLPIMQAVAHTPPAPPGLSPDLDTVLLKALAKGQNDRYASIERLDEDLRRILADEPILACRVPWRRRLGLLVRRHRRSSIGLAVAACGMAAMAAVALQQGLASRAQEARAAAVRDFMFDLVSDAEADETQAGAEVTGRQMVDAAVARARRELGGNPHLQGELLGELGRMYARLGAPAQAAAILQEAVATLAAHAGESDVALNKARAHLAGQMLESDPARARLLATQAVAACSVPGPGCAKARSYAHAALVSLYAAQGQDALALEHAQASLAATRLGFGERAPDTARALEWLAVAARNAGQLVLADQAIGQAVAMSDGTHLRASQRLSMRGTQALLALDLGRYEQARQELAELLAQANDADDAVLHARLLAQAHWALGQPQQALDASRRSADIARQQGDAVAALVAQQTGARALAALGRVDEALLEIDGVNRALRASGLDEGSRVVLRGLRIAAEIRLRAGDAAGAAAQATRGVSLYRAMASPPATDLAEALDLLGCAERAQGRAEAARQAHRQAGELWQHALPPGHPLAVRHALYTALAADDAVARAQAAPLVRQLAAALPEGSAWREALQPWLSPDAPAPALEHPLLLL